MHSEHQDIVIMSILVHTLKLRLSADEKVELAPSCKCPLLETARRRWLECNLTRDHFRTPCCSLIVVWPQTFGRHQLRLCKCYVNLSALLYSNVPILQFLSEAKIGKTCKSPYNYREKKKYSGPKRHARGNLKGRPKQSSYTPNCECYDDAKSTL